jgi:hypothetical protein
MGPLIDFFCLLALTVGLLTIRRTYYLWPLHVFLVASEITNLVFFYTENVALRTNIHARFNIIQIAAFILIFKEILKLKQYKIFIILSACSFGIILLKIPFFSAPYSTYSIASAVPSLLIVSACMIYFFNVVRSAYTVNPFRTSSFWIVLGLLFRYLFVIPMIFWQIYLHPYDLRITSLLPYITEFFYILLYICLTKAFLCKIKN